MSFIINYFVKSVTKIYFSKIYYETDIYQKTTFQLERKSDFHNKLFCRELFAKFFISLEEVRKIYVNCVNFVRISFVAQPI